jgi:hypothetical protein
MDTASPASRSLNATNVFVMLLAVALALLALLLLRSVVPPGSGPAFTISEVAATTCPSDQGAPACFRVSVNNSGTEAGNVRCELLPAADTTAEFLSGGTVYVSGGVVETGQTLPLMTQVNVTGTNDTVVSPSVSCVPL